MINKVILVGNLGTDPELRQTKSGMAVANFALATSEKGKDKEGNPTEKTEWHRINVWDKQAENAAKYLVKGSKIYLEGRINTRKWQDKEGQDRYTTEITAQIIQFLTPKGDLPAATSGQQAGQQQPAPNIDDIPF